VNGSPPRLRPTEPDRGPDGEADGDAEGDPLAGADGAGDDAGDVTGGAADEVRGAGCVPGDKDSPPPQPANPPASTIMTSGPARPGRRRMPVIPAPPSACLPAAQPSASDRP